MTKQESKPVLYCEIHFNKVIDIIEKHYINQKCSDGIFMESGAFDGVSQSLSLFLEEKYDFNGVLVEPMVREYRKLPINRPKCFNFNLCLSNENGKKEFLEMGMRSSIKDTEFNVSTLQYLKSGRRAKSTKIVTQKASTLFDSLNLNYLDIWILDVEGHELQALQGYNFKDHPVYLIIVEVQRRRQFPKEYEKIETLLKSKGFSLKHHPDITEDEFWVNENYFRKDKLYKKNNLLTKVKTFLKKND